MSAPDAARRSRALLIGLICLFTTAAGAAAAPDLAAIRALRDSGAYEAALAAARQAREANPQDVDVALIEGQLLCFTQRHGEAIGLLRQALARAPDYADLRAVLARCLRADGHSREARAVLRPALAASEDPDLWLLEYALARELGDGSGAAMALARAQELAPDHPQVLLAAGDAAAAAGRFELAAGFYQRVLESGASTEVARRRMAGVARERRRFLLTVAGNTSRLSQSAQPDWYELDLGLEWRADARTRWRGRLGRRHRFGEQDTLVGGGVERRIGSAVASVDLAFAPAPDFSPELDTRLALELPLLSRSGPVGAVTGRIEAGVARYDDGSVLRLGLGLTRYAPSGRWWLSAMLNLTRDEAGRPEPGFGGRLDLQLDPRLRLLAGTSLDRDGTDNGTVAERTWYAGVVLEIDDRLRLFADLAHVDREDAADRLALGLGVAVAF